jgi:hypothetical protein
MLLYKQFLCYWIFLVRHEVMYSEIPKLIILMADSEAHRDQSKIWMIALPTDPYKEASVLRGSPSHSRNWLSSEARSTAIDFWAMSHIHVVHPVYL